MKLYFKIILLVTFTAMLTGCPKDDSITVPPPRPYTEVYPEDLAKIEGFLDTHYVTVDADFNTTFTEIEDGGTEVPVSQMAELESFDVTVASHGITYKVYYLKLQEGVGESPTRIDSAFVSYKGFSFSNATKVVGGVTTNYVEQTVFDQRISPIWFNLEEVIRGWGEVIPKFKTGTYTTNPNGAITYSDYGAGVMFLPSGLGYYNLATGNIGNYSPLIFNFKLYAQRYKDHDRDGFLSKDEYGAPFNEFALDTDGDGAPDYLDQDDDNDGFTTLREREIPGSNPKQYYDFATMPNCNGGTKKIHLDKSCKPTI